MRLSVVTLHCIVRNVFGGFITCMLPQHLLNIFSTSSQHVGKVNFQTTGSTSSAPLGWVM